MRAVLRREVEVAAPAPLVWGYVTDWPRQGEWIPRTRVERVDAAAGLGGRLRAWTGVGPVGFWDEMTITAWEDRPDGGGRCEVLHTGRVVRGEGEFEVVAVDADSCRFLWSELLVLPMGQAGAAAWKAVGPLVGRGIDGALDEMRTRAEEMHG
jgi:hypothetical protein